jgi:hypothetical protein
MAEAAQSAQHEFWRPPITVATDLAGQAEMVEACDRCGTEFIVDSRFCHTCGANRANHLSTVSRLRDKVTLAHFMSVGESLGLTTAAFLAFAAGILCVGGAIAVGFIFSARTVLDWQAVQLWRIEWLLGAVAAFVAGCLLKKSS